MIFKLFKHEERAQLTATCTLSCFLRQTLVTNLLWNLLSTISNMFDISPMAFRKLRMHKGTAELTASCKKTVGSALFFTSHVGQRL